MLKDDDIRNLRHNAAGTIDCEIRHPVHGWIPFTAAPDDAEPLGRRIHQRAEAGDLGTIAPAPSAPAPTWEQIRCRRDALLVASDWTQLPDSPLDADAREAWANFRRQLRDLPRTYSDPAAVKWPAGPEKLS